MVNNLPRNVKLCFVGDLIDRGPNSKEVIEFVKLNDYDCVIGNHEQYFIDCILKILNNEIDDEVKKWIFKYGGKETLESYTLKDNTLDTKLLETHLEYLKSLPYYIEYKNLRTNDNRCLVVSHSHVGNKWEYKDFPKDSIEYKQFIKIVSLSRFKNHDNKNIYNVFGHTPIEKVDIENRYKANIDSGCVYGNGTNMKGYLIAFGFPSLEIFRQENIEYQYTYI